MEAAKDFLSFYRSVLVPVIDVLEEERKKINKIIYLALVVAIAYLLIRVGISIFSDAPVASNAPIDPYAARNMGPQPVGNPNAPGAGGSFLYLIITGGLGYYFWFLPRSKNLKTRFKSEVIHKIVKFVDGSLDYYPGDGISKRQFIDSNIFLTGGDRYTSEDLVSGKLGNTSIRFSEVHSESEDTDGDLFKKAQSKSYRTLFKGILFVADFNKNFNGRTVVLTDQAEKTFGSLGTLFQKLNQRRDPLIKMDDVKFENAFAVYGTDPVEAHYILSPALMQRILDLKVKAGNIQMSFVDSSVYIAIPRSENLFESNLFSPIISYGKLETYHYYIRLVAGIVDDLNLNNRIWTKE